MDSTGCRVAGLRRTPNGPSRHSRLPQTRGALQTWITMGRPPPLITRISVAFYVQRKEKTLIFVPKGIQIHLRRLTFLKKGFLSHHTIVTVTII